MKSLKFCFISFVVFISCQQNEYSLPDESLKDVPFEQNNELSIPLYTRNQIENNTGSISPDIEFLKEIRDYLSQDSEFLDAQHQLVENYGKLYWSHAVLDVTDESTYLMCLPFIKYEEYSGLLIITGHGDHVDLNFVDVYTLRRCIRENTITSDNFYLTYALTKLSYLEYIRNNRVIKSYVDALHEIFNFSGIELELRSEIDVSYWSEGPGQLEDDSWALVAKLHKRIIPCNGGGGGAGGSGVDTSLGSDGPAGGSSGNTDNNNDENDDNDEVITVEDLLDDLSIDDDCVNLLSNEAVLQARELLRNTTFPCDDRTDEEILSDILNALCDESGVNSSDSDDGLLSDLDINVDLLSGGDLSEGLGGYDRIKVLDNTTDCEKSLKDQCPKLKDILDNFVGDKGDNPNCSLIEELGESPIESTYFLDCDKNFVQDKLGRTTTSDSNRDDDNNAIKVGFSPDLCNKSCVEILNVVVHESVHAKILNSTLITVPEGFNSDAHFINVHRQIRSNQFDGEIQDHRIMAKFLALEMAKAMHEMIGIGDPQDYLFWSYQGLGIDPSEFLNTAQISEMNQGWNNIKQEVDENYKC